MLSVTASSPIRFALTARKPLLWLSLLPLPSFVYRVDCAGDRGWSDGDIAARETTPLDRQLGAIWLNLPEEQADLKD